MRLIMRGTIPPLPHTSSWPGASLSTGISSWHDNLLKPRDKFSFSFSSEFIVIRKWIKEACTRTGPNTDKPVFVELLFLVEK
jgi:hypothetical protein